MTTKDFVVSGDGHLLEPIDLFRTRLPKHLRDHLQKAERHLHANNGRGLEQRRFLNRKLVEPN